jgi:hypothetical protein
MWRERGILRQSYSPGHDLGMENQTHVCDTGYIRVLMRYTKRVIAAELSEG